MPDDPAKIGTDEEHWTLMTVSDKSKEVVRLLAEMYAKNGIHNGVGTLVDEDDGYAAFNNNTLASYGYSYGYYTQFKKLYDSWMSAHQMCIRDNARAVRSADFLFMVKPPKIIL